MATISRTNSFQKRLLWSIGGIFLFFAICFSVWQYQREKEYKIELMHSRLQMYNYEMIHSLGDSIGNSHILDEYIAKHRLEGIRVTVMDTKGNVLHDTYQIDIASFPNHLKRPEIQSAIKKGNGFDKRRTSESTHETYFYSATRFNDIIIRTAVPYNAEVSQMLEADKSYLLYALVFTLLIGIILYQYTARIARHIGYLREFAVNAEKGEKLEHELERELPDDELGEISHTIITLYWKLRHAEEDKQRLKRQLTQNAAHELKTPAASIHGYLETIIEHPDMDEDRRVHFLQRCFAQSERMNKLLQDMDMLTKLDELSPSQTVSPSNHNSNVIEIINAVLDDTSLQLESCGLVPIVQLPETIEVGIDPSFVYSIFRNLVDNAIAYATGATTIHIKCRETTKDYEFVFADNGIGVPSIHLPHLFERFYRVDKGRSRKMGGTGLGLAIVKNAVIACGGTCSAESTVGGGLTIRFSLAR